jgi:hypothetical protein
LRIYEDLEDTGRRLIPILVEPVDRTLIRPAIRRLDTVDLTDPASREAEFLHFLRSLGVTSMPMAQLPPWPETSSIAELHIADITDVSRWGWNGHQLLEKLISIDYETLDNLTPEHEGHASQWTPVFMDHPDTWRLLVTPSNEIVGYWHFVPLFDDDFRCALNGELADSQITTDRIRIFEFPGDYPIYFVSFGLLSTLRRTKAYKLLLNSLFDVIHDLARDGIFINQICANAFSPSGESMCKTFGMVPICAHKEHGKIYSTTLNEILQLSMCQGHEELAALYRRHSFSSGN